MKTLLAVCILIFAQLVLPSFIIVKRGISESDQKDAIDAANKFRREYAKKNDIANMNELTYDAENEKLAEADSQCEGPTRNEIYIFSDFDRVDMATEVFFKTIACTKAPKPCKFTFENKRQIINEGDYFCVVGPRKSQVKNFTTSIGEPGSKCPEETVSKDGLCGINGGYLVNFNLLILFLSIFYALM
ncbi:hypothetical protein CAEBREN_04968 [Caenorhabditis brenneri]|uniref:Uncharacterized protein n=1 Tax=Caenorhabditis brenneri TaxID=135651 RepID=G0NDG9_CAEBE|nr:hypothetical protein CAEBREN_04968 [Caenorhabditis brenneri]